MGALLQYFGAVWAALGTVDIILGVVKGASALSPYAPPPGSLVAIVVVTTDVLMFIFPALLLAGLGTLINLHQQS